MEKEFFNTISQIKADSVEQYFPDSVRQKPLNILLVELANMQFQAHNFPLQLFTLAGALADRDGYGNVVIRHHNVTVTQSNSPRMIVQYLADNSQANKLDVIGISAHHGNWDCLNNTLAALQELPDTQRPHIILGGHLASNLHEDLINRHTGLPLSIAVGYGDSAFRLYIDMIRTQEGSNRLPYDIPGIVNSQNRRLIRPRRMDNSYPWLDGVPFADQDSKDIVRMEASRGCYYNKCTFCSRPEHLGWIKYPLDDVIKQIVSLAKRGYKRYAFSDEEVVGSGSERFTELLLRMRDLRAQYPDLEFFINVRADNIVVSANERQSQLDKMWKLAKEAGIVMVWVGTESYSPRQLKIYNKGEGITPQSNLDSLRKLDSLGLKVLQGFIPFHPMMTETELSENLEFINKHRGTIVHSLDNPLGFLRIGPNTRYLRYILRLQEERHPSFLKGFDQNTISYTCGYSDPRLGMLASFLYSLNNLTRLRTKLIQWGIDTDCQLVQMRDINFNLLNMSYDYLSEPVSVGTLEKKLVKKLLPWYHSAVNSVHTDFAEDDFCNSFTAEFERIKSIFVI